MNDFVIFLGGVLMVLGVLSICGLYMDADKVSEEVPCYDKYNNVINNVTCTKDVSNVESDFSLVVGYSTVIIGLVVIIAATLSD